MESLNKSWKPTNVVAIDFGMTCTAVAYSSSPEWSKPDCVQKWPGQQHGSLANKAATHVAYDGRGNLVSWGFLCLRDTMPTTIEKEFKLYLDPSFQDSYPNIPTNAEAVRWYKDYMKSLHQYLESFFQKSTPDWSQRHVEFLFSIPTTWTSPTLTAMLESWLNDAGFSNTSTRRVKFSQTEAEAAAVYAAKQGFKAGEIVMVADAGGATTDINILEIKEHSNTRTQLTALNRAEGINVGSTLIDGYAKEMLKARLQAKGIHDDEGELHWLAEDMLQSCNFEDIKCAFEGSRLQLDIYVDVPAERLLAAHQGRRQQIVITAEELRSFFDLQLDIMFEAIHRQMRELLRDRPDGRVRYLVLSGGLGSSPYVQKRMKAEFANVQVLCAAEPQLAVAKGLVMDRIQTLSKGSAIYTGKCCRVSYGVLCRVPYDKAKHLGARVTKDSLDGITYAEDQIDWLIKQDQPVPEKGFSRPYRLKVERGREDDMFEAQFVMSESSARHLPRDLRADDVSRICTVKAQFNNEDFDDYSSQHFKRKRGGFMSKRKDHYVAEFNLKVIVGSADLTFELVSKDGEKYNLDDASINVTWVEAPQRKKKKSKNPRNPELVPPVKGGPKLRRRKSWEDDSS